MTANLHIIHTDSEKTARHRMKHKQKHHVLEAAVAQTSLALLDNSAVVSACFRKTHTDLTAVAEDHTFMRGTWNCKMI